MSGWDKLAGTTAQAKFFICYYDPDFSALGVTKAYLTTAGGGGGDAPVGDGNAKTGDSTMIFVAMGALVLAAGATVLVVRKVKA
jgi:LPXTG-motif cell wall-anchored protein